jgi:hypothetical protein
MARSQPGQLVGNAAQSPAPSSMKAGRVNEFGPPEAMFFETVQTRYWTITRSASKTRLRMPTRYSF